MAAETASRALRKAKKSASPCRSTSLPPFAPNDACRSRWCSASSFGYSGPSRRTRSVDRSMSVNRNVTVPLGNSTVPALEGECVGSDTGGHRVDDPVTDEAALHSQAFPHELLPGPANPPALVAQLLTLSTPHVRLDNVRPHDLQRVRRRARARSAVILPVFRPACARSVEIGRAAPVARVHDQGRLTRTPQWREAISVADNGNSCDASPVQHEGSLQRPSTKREAKRKTPRTSSN